MDTDLDTLLAKLAATPRQEAPIDSFTGTRRYEMQRRLGGGAFGDVYEARDREHGTHIALKALKSSQPDWIYRFKREFRLVGDLSHPNVARVFQLFCEDDRWYLTMELVDGVPFDAHIARAPEETRSSFVQLARALSALHGAGCLHRDVKPSNALVERSGRVVLLDFGLAVERDVSMRTAVAGTPPFMAPELAMGDRPTEAADWYAFGVMLYHALAETLPFTGSRSEVFSSKLAGNAPPPSFFKPGADAELEALAMDLLAPSSSDRPVGEDILARLEGAQARRRRARKLDSELVARERELSLLDLAFESARASIPVVATVRGDAGMGKTTLIHSFVDRCRAAGGQVYMGRCHESEVVPYKGIDGAIDMLCDDLAGRRFEDVAALTPGDIDALAQMFPVLKRVPAFGRTRGDQRVRSPHDARRLASRALRELLLRLTTTGPVVLVVDDFHWGNADGAQVLVELVAAPAPPLLTIIAHREVEPGQAAPLETVLSAVRESGAIKWVDVEVRPFDDDAVARVLASNQRESLDVGRAMKETGGHPYLLSRMLAREGFSTEAALDLGAMLAAEIEELPAPARAVLEAVSLAAVPLGAPAAFEIAGSSVDAEVIDYLRRNKLVQRASSAESGPIETYHDRVRETALAAMSGERRCELHLRVAEVLECRALGDAQALAFHYRLGGDRERALLWTLRAARSAGLALAFSRAVVLLGEAVGLARDDHERIDVLEELAEAQVYVGRRADAGESLLEASLVAGRLGDTVRRSALRARAGEHFLLFGDHERGFVLVEEALEEVGFGLPPTPTLAVAESINLGGQLATRGCGFERTNAIDVDPATLAAIDLGLGVAIAISLTDIRAPWIASRVLLAALEAGEPRRVQRALAIFALNNSGRAPNHPFVLETLARSRELAEELTDEQGMAWTHYAECMFHLQRNELTAAIASARVSERLFLASRVNAREAALCRVAVAIVEGNLGLDVPAATEVVDDITAEAMARGDNFAANWSRLVAIWIALCADEPARAAEHMDHVQAAWPEVTDSMFGAVVQINRMFLELYRDPDHAWDAVVRLRPAFERSFTSLIAIPRHLYNRAASYSAVCAYNAGLADRATTLERIAPRLADLDKIEHHEAAQCAVRAVYEGIAEGRHAYVHWLERARDGYVRRRQRTFALGAEYRLHQARGDDARAARVAEEMRRLRVANPEAYSRCLAAPLPRWE